MRWRPFSLDENNSPSAGFAFPFFVMGLSLGKVLESSVLHVGGAIRERLASAAVTRTSFDIPGPTFEGGRDSITQSEDLLGDFVWNRVVLSHLRRDIYEYQGLLAICLSWSCPSQ